MPSLRWSAHDAFQPEEGSREHLRIVHGLSDHANGLRYTIFDTEHFIHQEEIDAIERSGRSSWQHYAEVPTVWHERPLTGFELMHDRPGHTAPIIRPFEHRHGERWTDIEKLALLSYKSQGLDTDYIAMVLGRSPAAIDNMLYIMTHAVEKGKPTTGRELRGIGYKMHWDGATRCKTMNSDRADLVAGRTVNRSEFVALNPTQRCAHCEQQLMQR